jgi:starch-binding outer membrane protein, SusD/RagB family
MKISNNILSIVFIAVIAAGCNKKLDVVPQNTITPDQLTTAEDIKAVLFGAYSTLQNANAFGEKYITIPELLFADDEINWAGTFAAYTDFYRKEAISQNSEAYEIWGNSYQTIAGVNLVLSKLELISEEERPAIEAEAKFLRGLVYFELVNLFALPYSFGNTTSNPGVPVVTEFLGGYDPERDKRPRASVEDVYTQIVNDLTFASESLPEENDNFRATKYSAFAILSRVYLAQLKYPEAAQAADSVIESGAHSLTTSYAQAFNNAVSSTEDIFAIQQTSQSNSGTTNFGITTLYAADPIGRGEIQVTEDFVDKFDEEDTRGKFVYEGESISGTVGLFTGKYQELYRAIPVVRLAEMYLTRAEANYRSGAQVGAKTPLEDVNEIRQRAGANPLLAITSADQIVDERFKELAFEGEKYLTMKRLKMNVGTIPYDDPFLILPIPQREIDLGNALPQNEGYN